MAAKFPGFKRCMAMMRQRRDPQLQEDEFHLLLPHSSDHVIELMNEFAMETDPGLRCWLLELIASARSAAALPLLAAELRSEDEGLRLQAVRGLKALDTKEARTLLWHAKSFVLDTPEKTEAFRRQLNAP